MDNRGKHTRQLEHIIALSRDMLASARENAWERVAELDAQRRTLVMQCFARPTPQQDALVVAAAIREILSLNQQVTELGEAQQQTLGDELHTNRVGHTAKVAYQRCAP